MAFSRFTLDTSELDDLDVGLDGSPFPMNATASADFGAGVSSASALVSHVVSAEAVLGGVEASASVSVLNVVSAQAVLGGVVAFADEDNTTQQGSTKDKNEQWAEIDW